MKEFFLDKKKLIFTIVICIVIILASILKPYIFPNKQSEEDILNSILYIEHNCPKNSLIEQFKLGTADNTETFCLADSGDGIGLFNIVFGGDGTLDVVEIQKEFSVGRNYSCKKTYGNGFYMEYRLFDTDVSNNICYRLIEFNYKGKTYWLSIDSFERTSTDE